METLYFGFAVFIVLFIVLLCLLIKTKNRKQAKRMNLFLQHAHEVSGNLVPEVKGFDTLLVQGSISRKEEKEILHKDRLKNIATSAAIRIVTGNQKHLHVDLVNRSDYYIVRYHEESIYFFNVGAKFKLESLEFMGDMVYRFDVANLSSIQIQVDKVTLSDQAGDSFIFDLQATNQANGLLLTKETKAFKVFLKKLQGQLQ